LSTAYSIRAATAADLPALTALCREMERHYDGPAAVDEAVIRLALARQLSEPSGVEILVADAAGRLLGLATVSVVFPATRFAPALFLKDIYVAAEARDRGVGTGLMRAVARMAVARGCCRVNWNADRANAAALDFYTGRGARVLNDSLTLLLDGDALRRLAAEADDG
jgi:GNAT superfamily N-acetyltransferase